MIAVETLPLWACVPTVISHSPKLPLVFYSLISNMVFIDNYILSICQRKLPLLVITTHISSLFVINMA